jgi:hypothetical protein
VLVVLVVAVVDQDVMCQGRDIGWWKASLAHLMGWTVWWCHLGQAEGHGCDEPLHVTHAMHRQACLGLTFTPLCNPDVLIFYMQGFTRPKVLILLPQRNLAFRLVLRLVRLAMRETRADSVQVGGWGAGGAKGCHVWAA